MSILGNNKLCSLKFWIRSFMDYVPHFVSFIECKCKAVNLICQCCVSALVSMRIRIQLFTSMRIRILEARLTRIRILVRLCC
jgi:hypothetical protein